MPIYEAEFLGDPAPIQTSKKARKVKRKVSVEPAVPAAEPAPAEPAAKKRRKKAPSPPKEPEAPPPPPPVDNKKKTKKKTPTVEPVAQEEPKEEEVVAPKRKRVAKPKAQPSQQVIEEAKEEIANDEKTVKKIVKLAAKKAGVNASKKIIDGVKADEPPTWFKNYLLNEAKRRNSDKQKPERIPVKEVKRVAEEKASEKWNDGLTRDKVNNEVHSHMNRLYSQIHGRRF